MAKVRTIQVKDVGNLKTAFVYRGFYCIKNGTRAFHTSNVLRNNSNLENVTDDDEFNLAHGSFDSPENFKSIVDEHIDYIEESFGSLRKYFRLNMGLV